MRETIIRELEMIESRENVRILYCCEAGSRAFGFNSPESDYDVRFVYVRKTEDYLKLAAFRDVIDRRTDDTLDINGWDIRKLLRLLYISNPAIFEWRGSPAVYRTTDFWEKNSPLFDEYFSERAAVLNYLNIASNSIKAYLSSDTVKLKKYLHILRAVWACRWVTNNKTPPPVFFERLYEEYCPDDLRDTVSEILEKRRSDRLAVSGQITALTNYLYQQKDELTELAAAYEKAPPKSWDTLDRIFLEALKD